MKILRALDRLLVRAEGILLVAFLGTIVLLAFAQVLLRNLFGFGLLWADPLVRHFVLWSGFLGGALAAAGDRHISIDALTRFLPPRIKAGANTLTHLFAAGACGFLARAGLVFLLSEYDAGSTTFLDLPVWMVASVIPAGYLLMGVHFILRAAEALVVLSGRGGETTPP